MKGARDNVQETKTRCRATTFKRCSAIAFASVLFVPILGCEQGPTLYEVSGRVTLDGEPLTRGVVRFVPEKGVMSVSPIAEDGSFVMKCRGETPGVYPGRHRVAVYAGEILGEETIRWHAPKAYAHPGTTPLEQVVEEPIDNLEIKLQWGHKPGPYVERL